MTLLSQTSYQISGSDWPVTIQVTGESVWTGRREEVRGIWGEIKHELAAQTPDKEPEKIQQYSMKTNIVKTWEHKVKPGVVTDGQRGSVGKRIKSQANPPLTALLTAIRKLASPPKRLAIVLETGTYAMGITSIGTPFFHCWPRALEPFLRGKNRRIMISFSLWRPAKLSFHLLKVNQQTHTCSRRWQRNV